MQPRDPAPEQPTPTPPSRLRPRLAVLGLLVLAVAAFYFSGLGERLSWGSIRDNLTSWKAQTDDNLLLVLVVFVAVYVAATALSLPIAAPLSLIAGVLFGRWLGTAVVNVASTAGATLAFLSSRYLFRDWVRRRFGKWIAPVERGVERDGAFYLFTLRLTVVVPFWLVNLAMGLTPMRTTTFAAVSCVGMVLGSFLYVNVGAEAGTQLTANSPRDLFSWTLIGSLALLGVVPLLIRLGFRWLRRGSPPEQQP